LMYCLLAILLYVAAAAVVVVSVRRFRDHFRIWHALVACVVGFPVCSILTLLACDVWARNRIERYQRELDGEIRERSNVVYERVVLYQQPRDANFAGFYEWAAQAAKKYPEIDWHYKIDRLSEQQENEILHRSLEDLAQLRDWLACGWISGDDSYPANSVRTQISIATIGNLCMLDAIRLARSGAMREALDIVMEMLNVGWGFYEGRDAVAIMASHTLVEMRARDLAAIIEQTEDESDLFRVLGATQRIRQSPECFADAVRVSFLEEKKDILAEARSDSWYPRLRRLGLKWKPAKFCLTTSDLVDLYEARAGEMIRFDPQQVLTRHAPALGRSELLSERTVMDAQGLEGMAWVDLERKTLLDLLDLACGVRIYELRNGRLPDRLEQLTGLLRSASMMDPFSRNERFHYRRECKVLPGGCTLRFVLYSNGWNCRDDGGTDGGYDLQIWPLLRRLQRQTLTK
jgi:hypothetical protein